jgi:hypothetical protein
MTPAGLVSRHGLPLRKSSILHAAGDPRCSGMIGRILSDLADLMFPLGGLIILGIVLIF